jgi:hypothetical protein
MVIGFLIWAIAGETAPTSITDDKGNSYTTLASTNNSAAGGTTSGLIYFKFNITNGPTVITASWGATTVNFPQTSWDEYSGTDRFGGYNILFQQTPGTSTNAISTGNFSVASGDELWAASFSIIGNLTITVGTGFTQLVHDLGADWGYTAEQMSSSVTGTTTCTFTDSTHGAADEYITGGVSLKSPKIPPSSGGIFQPKDLEHAEAWLAKAQAALRATTDPSQIQALQEQVTRWQAMVTVLQASQKLGIDAVATRAGLIFSSPVEPSTRED